MQENGASLTKYLSKISLVAVGIFLSLVFVAQLSVYFSPSPSVIPDELTYQRFVYSFDRSNSGIGTPLYSFAYGWTSGCGEVWYQCVKSFNLFWDVVFAIATATAVYKLTKSWLVSAISGVAVWFGPFTMYGQNFMPESMLGAMIALAFTSLILLSERPKSAGVVAGVFLGLAMLVKPHAFFVFLGFLAFFLIRLAFWRNGEKSGLTTTLGFLVLISITIRSTIAIVVFGVAGLNPLAGYVGAITSPPPVPADGNTSLLIPSSESSAILQALISFVVNLSPGLLFLSFVLVSIQLAVHHSLRDIFSDRAFAFASTIFLSLLFMAAAFGAFLELRGMEATIFRSMTRYWEYAAAFVLVTGIAFSYRGQKGTKSRPSIGLLISVILLSVLLLLIPRVQTQSDSSLLFPSVIPLVLLVIVGVLALFSFRQRFGRPIPAIVMAAVVVGIGSTSNLSTFSFTHQEKAGVAVGKELAEIIKQRPEDAGRVVFLGERTAGIAAAFIARLGEANFHPAPEYYARVDYLDIPNSPRWVIASKETFVVGSPVEKRVYGDTTIYEFGYPLDLKPSEFKRFGIESQGNFLSTYWGSWVVGEEFSFNIPNDMSGDTLEISLLLNDELSDSRVSIDFGEGPIQGEIETGQIMTPVTLTALAGTEWAGKRVTVRYLGDQKLVEASKKQLGLGFGGFRVFNGGQ